MKAAGIPHEKRRPPSVGRRRRPTRFAEKARSRAFSIDGYVNDAVGRRTSMSRSGSAYSNPDTIFYAYNDRNELTGAVSDVDTSYSYAYAYDPIGNRVTASEAGVPWTYTTNSLNQYTSATENNVQMDFSYDLDGSMTYRPVDATSGWTQVWDCENRMVETYNGNNRLTFKYDYLGRRVEKCVYNGNTLASKTYFVYDGFKCVEELDALNNNAIFMRHFWQPFDVGLDVILATMGSNGTSYFLHDTNKNVIQKTDLSGTLLESYTYAPFGGYIDSTTAHFGFSSEFSDDITEMLYYNYRYYAKQIGKWVSIDPKYNNSQYVINANTKGNVLNLLSKDKNNANNKMPNFINHKLSYLTYNYICNDINRIDFLGLDAPGCDLVPDFLEIECVLECCAKHDRCYDINKCNFISWIPFCSSSKCFQCNIDVLLCIASCPSNLGKDRGDDYYCNKCHKFLKNEKDLLDHMKKKHNQNNPPRRRTPHHPGGHGGYGGR